MYIHTQKEKKKGFGSGDFRRKDEFSNTIRTGQYRHQLDVSAFFHSHPVSIGVRVRGHLN